MKFCQILKKMASTSKNQRWTKGGEANQAMPESLLLGAIIPDDKPETLRTSREPTLEPFHLISLVVLLSII